MPGPEPTPHLIPAQAEERERRWRCFQLRRPWTTTLYLIGCRASRSFNSLLNSSATLGLPCGPLTTARSELASGCRCRTGAGERSWRPHRSPTRMREYLSHSASDSLVGMGYHLPERNAACTGAGADHGPVVHFRDRPVGRTQFSRVLVGEARRAGIEHVAPTHAPASVSAGPIDQRPRLCLRPVHGHHLPTPAWDCAVGRSCRGLLWLFTRNLYATIVAHAVEVILVYSAVRAALI